MLTFCTAPRVRAHGNLVWGVELVGAGATPNGNARAQPGLTQLSGRNRLRQRRGREPPSLSLKLMYDLRPCRRSARTKGARGVTHLVAPHTRRTYGGTHKIARAAPATPHGHSPHAKAGARTPQCQPSPTSDDARAAAARPSTAASLTSGILWYTSGPVGPAMRLPGGPPRA